MEVPAFFGVKALHTVVIGDAFGHRIRLADVMQPLYADGGDFKRDAAGPARHVDAGAPQQTAAILGGRVVDACVLRDQPRRQMVIGVRGRPRLSYVEAVSADAMA